MCIRDRNRTLCYKSSKSVNPSLSKLPFLVFYSRNTDALNTVVSSLFSCYFSVFFYNAQVCTTLLESIWHLLIMPLTIWVQNVYPLRYIVNQKFTLTSTVYFYSIENDFISHYSHTEWAHDPVPLHSVPPRPHQNEWSIHILHNKAFNLNVLYYTITPKTITLIE